METDLLNKLATAYRACSQLQRSLMGLHVEFERAGLPGLSIHALRLLVLPPKPDGRQPDFDTSLLRGLALRVPDREASLWDDAVTTALYQKNGRVLDVLSEMALSRLRQ